jgi:hypothetical protein
MTTTNAVLGLVSTYPQADNLVEALRRAGFAPKNISVLFPDIDAARDQLLDASKASGNGNTALANATRHLTDDAKPRETHESGLTVVALGSKTRDGAVSPVTMLGVQSAEAKPYEAKMKHGYVLVGVRADGADEQKRAETAYESAGAEDVKVAAAGK